MSTDPSVKKLKSLTRKHRPDAEPEFPDANDPVAVLVFSYLMWEASTDHARRAYRKIDRFIVDFNDLRVCLPHEVAETIAQTYPRGLERCQRMRASLNDIYYREHEVSLKRLDLLGKREIRVYIETLDGIVPYVAARLMQLRYNVHAVPIDDQLRAMLIEERAAKDSIEVPEAAAWLSRSIRADDAREAHFALQTMVDSQWDKPGKRKKNATRKRASSSGVRKKSKNTRAVTSSSRKKS